MWGIVLPKIYEAVGAGDEEGDDGRDGEYLAPSAAVVSTPRTGTLPRSQSGHRKKPLQP